MEDDLYNTYNKELLNRKYICCLQINSKKTNNPTEKSARALSRYREASITKQPLVIREV